MSFLADVESSGWVSVEEVLCRQSSWVGWSCCPGGSSGWKESHITTTRKLGMSNLALPNVEHETPSKMDVFVFVLGVFQKGTLLFQGAKI